MDGDDPLGEYVGMRMGRRGFLGAAASLLTAVPFGPAAAARTSGIVALVGDCLFATSARRDYPGTSPLLSLLRDADVAVGNFEGALPDPDNWASLINPGGTPICGGLNVRGNEAVPGDLRWLGIDMVSTANNHALDWGIGGMLATSRKLDAAGIQSAGTGRDLPAAAAPAFHEGTIGRTALISFASTYWPGALASRGNAAIPGRPGLNPLRYLTAPDDPSGPSWAQPDDLQRITDSVRAATARADRVIVSCHTHEGADDWPPDFLRQVAHACIDAGARIFFSHGPHKLRGLESYKGRPIFYSLGAFIYRVRDNRPLPEELFENCHLTGRDPEDYFARTAREWTDDVPFWQSVIARVHVDGPKVTGVDLMPVIIDHRDGPSYGMPVPATGADADAVLGRLQHLSKTFGTSLTVADGKGFWAL